MPNTEIKLTADAPAGLPKGSVTGQYASTNITLGHLRTFAFHETQYDAFRSALPI